LGGCDPCNPCGVDAYACWADCCSLDEGKLSPSTLQLAVVHSNGDVYWFPPINFRTYCALDLTHFPFDEHLCTIRILSWTYSEAEVKSTFQLNLV